MTWRDIDSLSAKEMVRLASKRAKVRMISGQYATLIRWPSTHENKHRGWQVRLENGSGVRFTVHAREVEAVDDGTD